MLILLITFWSICGWFLVNSVMVWFKNRFFYLANPELEPKAGFTMLDSLKEIESLKDAFKSRPVVIETSPLYKFFKINTEDFDSVALAKLSEREKEILGL